MNSIYQRALGSDFSKLPPQIQKRFSLNSQSGIAAVGSGIMGRIWHGAPYTLPFLYVGTWRSIMFPEHGTVFGTKLLRRAMEVLGKLLHRTEIAADRGW